MLAPFFARLSEAVRRGSTGLRCGLETASAVAGLNSALPGEQHSGELRGKWQFIIGVLSLYWAEATAYSRFFYLHAQAREVELVPIEREDLLSTQARAQAEERHLAVWRRYPHARFHATHPS
jgi:hypothetical protein